MGHCYLPPVGSTKTGPRSAGGSESGDELGLGWQETRRPLHVALREVSDSRTIPFSSIAEHQHSSFNLVRPCQCSVPDGKLRLAAPVWFLCHQKLIWITMDSPWIYKNHPDPSDVWRFCRSPTLRWGTCPVQDDPHCEALEDNFHHELIYWLVVEPTPLKNDGVKVSWNYDIPNIWKVIIHSCSKLPISLDVESSTGSKRSKAHLKTIPNIYVFFLLYCSNNPFRSHLNSHCPCLRRPCKAHHRSLPESHDFSAPRYAPSW